MDNRITQNQDSLCEMLIIYLGGGNSYNYDLYRIHVRIMAAILAFLLKEREKCEQYLSFAVQLVKNILLNPVRKERDV